jgi:hypothetical protein
MKILTDEQKTNYLRIALALSKIGVDKMMAELIWRTYEGLVQKQGNHTVDDQSAIEVLVNAKFETKKARKRKEKQEA